METRKLVHVIFDHQQGGLAAGSVMMALLGSLPRDWDLLESSVYNFDTISTGYLVGQYALQHDDLRPQELILFANCSPRSERPKDDEGNESEDFLYARLRNGVRVLGVNSGYSLSFIRGSIDELKAISVKSAPGQLRRRDVLPKVVGDIARGDFSSLGADLDPSTTIPEFPQGVIGYIDNFGNIKTTYRDHDELIRHIKTQGAGSRVRIEINGEVRAATLAIGSHQIMEGELAFSPGSSAYMNRYWEIYCRRGDAAAMFNNPVPGSIIKLMIHQK